MAKDAKRSEEAQKKALDIMHNCIAQSEDSLRVAYWEQNQEFLRGNQFVYVDPLDKHAYIIKAGVFLPSMRDTVKSTPHAPIDPHLRTLADAVKARALSNEMLPQVIPMTSEDEDRNSAEVNTGMMQALHEELEDDKLRRQAVVWMLPTGNAFLKDVWDKSIGGEVRAIDEESGAELEEQALDDDGQPLFEGEIASCVPPTHAMMVPEGVSLDEDLPWIGEKRVMPVDKIKEIWGKEVPEETDIADINTLAASGVESKTKTLKGHAVVYEVFLRPDKANKYGRHIIVANEQVLEDKPWDKLLTEKYPDEWHPYTHIQYIDNAGDYWAKSPMDYAVPLQMHINKLLRRIEDAVRTDKGVFITDKDAVDWDKVDLGSMEVPYIEKEIAGASVEWRDMQPSIQQLMQQKADTIERLNDIFSSYPVSRGNTDSSVTSGKQADLLQQANREQSNALMVALADAFERHWKKILRLVDVHYQDGRQVRIIGKNKQALLESYQRGQIKSFNVKVSNRAAFFMTPEGRKAEVLELLKVGALDINNPIVKMRLADVIGTGDSATFFDSFLAAIEMARWENEQFKNGMLEETDPFTMSQLNAPIEQFNRASDLHSNLIQQLAPQVLAAPEGADIPDLPPSPMQPPPVKTWRRARTTDNHIFHIEEHLSLAQSVEWEKQCQQMPQKREALEFHIGDHRRLAAPSPQASVNPLSPPGASAQAGAPAN